eukprot:gene4476-7857_t
MNESYKKDFSFTKIVHESAPEYFVTMVEIAPQKNGQLFLVEEDSGLNAMTSISQENDLNSKVQEFLKIAKEMTMALHHVHNKQIIHRDIKLSNFISTNTSSSTKPKLIDFGLATIVSRKSPSVSCSHPTDIPGTIKFNFGLKAKLDQELQLIGGLTKLESLQKCTDPNITLFCKILIASIDVMFLAPKSNRMLLMTNALMVLYLNITMGLMDTSAFSFAYAGWVFSFFFKSTDGYYLTTLGDKFFSKDVNPPYNVAAFKMIIGQGSVTGGNLKQHIENLNQGYKYSTLHSEYIFGAYCLLHETIAQVLNGENYLTLIQKCEIKSNEYMKSKNVFMRDCLQLILNFARDMTGVSNFKPEYKIPAFKKLKTVSSFILYMEGVLNYFKGNYEAAAPFFLDVDKIINNQMGLFGFYESKFYTLMTCIHLYNKSKDEKDLEDIQRRLKEYESFAILSPEFLYPKYRLASAFLETTQPNVDNFVVISKFEDIIESTTLFGLVTSTAIAYEIMLQFCHEKKFSAGICKMYLSECLRIWSSLSAKTKCNKLQQEYAKYVSIHRTNSMPSMSISASTTAMSGTSINSSYSTSPGYGATNFE